MFTILHLAYFVVLNPNSYLFFIVTCFIFNLTNFADSCEHISQGKIFVNLNAVCQYLHL